MVSFKTTLFAFAAGTAMAAPVRIAKREFSGQCTYYTPSQVMSGNSIGKCGSFLSDDAPIAAINAVQFDAMGDSVCGSWITVNYQGKSVRAQVADRCHDCASGNVDISLPLFIELTGNKDLGRVGLNTDSNKPLTWSFESGEGDGSEDNTPEPPATTTTAVPVATTTTAAPVATATTTTVAPVPTTATPTPTPTPEPETPEIPETPENNEVEEDNEVEENIEEDVEKQPIKNTVVHTVVEDKKPETPSNTDSTPAAYDDGMWDPSKTPGDKGFYTPKVYADGTY